MQSLSVPRGVKVATVLDDLKRLNGQDSGDKSMGCVLRQAQTSQALKSLASLNRNTVANLVLTTSIKVSRSRFGTAESFIG